MMSNRIRSIHLHLRREYRKENVKRFHLWEKIENKIANFSNHRIFSLKCNIKTPKGHHIVKKAEQALLNERIRLINNTINMLKIQGNTVKII